MSDGSELELGFALAKDADLRVVQRWLPGGSNYPTIPDGSSLGWDNARHLVYTRDDGMRVRSNPPIPDDATAVKVTDYRATITFEVEVDGVWVQLGATVTS